MEKKRQLDKGGDIKLTLAATPKIPKGNHRPLVRNQEREI